MSLVRSPKVLFPLLGVFAIATIAWSYSTMSAASAANERERSERDEAARLASDFRRLQNVSVQAAPTEQSAAEILDRVEVAMRSAGLRENAGRDVLQRVQPQVQPIRIPNTDYSRRTTQVTLSRVTLQDAVRFAQALEDLQQGMVVSHFRLTAPAETADALRAASRSSAPPAGNAAVERWTASFTLTQTIFSPTVTK